MESLDLTYKLIALKIKSKTLDRIYFMPQVFQEHNHCYDKRKNKKIKTTKIYLFLLPPLPFQDGGLLQTPTPPPTPIFFTAKTFENFFIDTWVSGQSVGKFNVR